MVGFARACFFALGFSATGQALHLYADTNYDGKLTEEDINTPGVAYFMANIGESERRCQGKYTLDEMHECNDAEGKKQRNLNYMARFKLDVDAEQDVMADRPIEQVGYSFSLTGDAHMNQNVRLFLLQEGGDEKNPAHWQFLEPSTELSSFAVSKGLELGIDARDFSRPGGWDGSVKIGFVEKDHEFAEFGLEPITKAEVEFQVAPLLIHHNLQKLEEVFTVSDKLMDETQKKPAHTRFVQEVSQFTTGLGGAQKPAHLVDSRNIWIQDWFESGYTSIPGEGGRPSVLRVLVKSSRDKGKDLEFEDDMKVYRDWRSSNIGATFAPLDGDFMAAASFLVGAQAMGNVELLPPYTGTNKKSYPLGRVITGKYEPTFKKDLSYISESAKFLAHQLDKAQPLAFDLSWTVNNHIDEILQVLPSTLTASGWALFVVDPKAGVELLQKNGRETAMSHPDQDKPKMYGRPLSVQELLGRRELVEFNQLVAEKVDAIVQKLVEEEGIPAENIVRVPTPFFHANPNAPSLGREFFENSNAICYKNGDESLFAASLYGNPINGVVSNRNYLLPMPYGPSVTDRDVFMENTREILWKHGITPHFMDDFWSHHIAHGDIHCGTNALRDASAQWWLKPGQ